jgi:hypothetical protein
VNGNDEKLDAQLRKLFGTLDAQPGFEARVAARVAVHAASAESRADLRAGLERRREFERRRLAREVWGRSLTAAGFGMAAGALVWRYAADISQWAQSGAVSAALESRQLSTLATAVLLMVLWPWMRRLPVLRDL